MVDIEVYKGLSPKAKEFYDKHEDYFDEMADKWGDFVDMATIIEEAAKMLKEAEEKSNHASRANEANPWAGNNPSVMSEMKTLDQK